MGLNNPIMKKNFADYGKPDNSPEALAIRETNRDRALRELEQTARFTGEEEGDYYQRRLFVEIWKLSTIADMVGCTIGKVKYAAKTGRLKTITIDGCIFVRFQDMRRWVDKYIMTVKEPK